MAGVKIASMELAKSAGQFLFGILRRFWIWAPAFLLDPYDLWRQLIKPMLPEKYQVDLPWSTDWAPWVLMGLIVWAAIITYHELNQRTRSPTSKPRVLFLRSKDRDGWWPFCYVVPLPDVVRKAYDMSQDSIAGSVARHKGLAGKGRLLSWYAQLIVGGETIPLFGRRPYSKKTIRVPSENAGDQFSNDANSLVDAVDENEITFDDLAIRKSDSRKRLVKIRRDYGEMHRPESPAR